MQVAYCEEQVECRRAVLLAHFGESFDPKRSCHGTCDVCAQHSGHVFEEVGCDLSPFQAAHLVMQPSQGTIPVYTKPLGSYEVQRVPDAGISETNDTPLSAT